MTNGKEEAVPIAKLKGDDGEVIVGWVYLWNTSELSILWIEHKLPAKYIDPPWTCPAIVPLRLFVYAAFLFESDGAFPAAW